MRLYGPADSVYSIVKFNVSCLVCLWAVDNYSRANAARKSSNQKQRKTRRKPKIIITAIIIKSLSPILLIRIPGIRPEVLIQYFNMKKTNFQRFYFAKRTNDWIMIENAAQIMGFENLKPKIMLLNLAEQWQQHSIVIHACMIIDVDHVPFCEAQTYELAENIPPIKYWNSHS